MSLDQGIVSAAKERAESLFSKGRYKEALSTYEKIKSYGDKDPRIYLRMGDIARKDEDSALAIDFYKQAANSFIKLGFIIKAIAVCKLIINIDPSEEDVQRKLAVLYARQGNEIAIQEKRQPAPEAALPPVSVPKTPLFSDFTGEEFLDVVKKVKAREFEPGAFVFHEGDPGDSIFIVADGEVEVIGRAKDFSKVRLALLKESAIFGEFGFFLNCRRTSDLVAVKRSTILELTKSDLDGIIQKHKRVEAVLFDFYKDRVVDRLMALSEIFRFMSEEDRKEILSRLTLVKFEKGETVMSEGEKGDTMYLIKSGRVSVWVNNKSGEPMAITRLSEGDSFGEIALATSRPRVASVTALTGLELVCFSRATIKDVLGKYPAIKGVLEKVIKERVVGVLKIKEHAQPTMI
ncbi:MAG: cyclic nucleotide-binding domain-containing protein [Deltaproteobacteria bacterium]|nr:cyclic nucleotide-binding domain-containing protein [Deltaproteobacteria bacterium]